MPKTKKDLPVQAGLPAEASAKAGDKKTSAPDFDKARYEGAKKMINAALRNIERAANYIEKMEQEERKEFYKNMPGIEGTFDGDNLVAEDGTKKEVPANYAAKSRLVFGDKLKVFEDGNRDVFKQIEKVERKKIEGILTKKEGRWFILADSGSYRISDVAAGFNNAQLNDEAEAFIPAGNLKAPFAALDRVKKLEGKKDEGEAASVNLSTGRAGAAVSEKRRGSAKSNFAKRKATKSKSRTTKPSKPTPKKSSGKKKPAEKDSKVGKEFVADILDKDDLR